MAVLPAIHGTGTNPKTPLVKQVNGVWLPMVAADPCTCCGQVYNDCPACIFDKQQVHVAISGFTTIDIRGGSTPPSPWFCDGLIHYERINIGYTLTKVSPGLFRATFATGACGSGIKLSEWVDGGLSGQKYCVHSVTATVTCGGANSRTLGFNCGVRIAAYSNLYGCWTGPMQDVCSNTLFENWTTGNCAADFDQFCNQGASCGGNGDQWNPGVFLHTDFSF